MVELERGRKNPLSRNEILRLCQTCPPEEFGIVLGRAEAYLREHCMGSLTSRELDDLAEINSLRVYMQEHTDSLVDRIIETVRVFLANKLQV